MEGVNIVMILFSGRTEYSDRKVIILPHYTIPCLPLSNTVVVCYGRVHCRIQSWIPGSVLFRLDRLGGREGPLNGKESLADGHLLRASRELGALKGCQVRAREDDNEQR